MILEQAIAILESIKDLPYERIDLIARDHAAGWITLNICGADYSSSTYRCHIKARESVSIERYQQPSVALLRVYVFSTEKIENLKKYLYDDQDYDDFCYRIPSEAWVDNASS